MSLKSILVYKSNIIGELTKKMYAQVHGEENCIFVPLYSLKHNQLHRELKRVIDDTGADKIEHITIMSEKLKYSATKDGGVTNDSVGNLDYIPDHISLSMYLPGSGNNYKSLADSLLTSAHRYLEDEKILDRVRKIRTVLHRIHELSPKSSFIPQTEDHKMLRELIASFYYYVKMNSIIQLVDLIESYNYDLFQKKLIIEVMGHERILGDKLNFLVDKALDEESSEVMWTSPAGELFRFIFLEKDDLKILSFVANRLMLLRPYNVIINIAADSRKIAMRSKSRSKIHCGKLVIKIKDCIGQGTKNIAGGTFTISDEPKNEKELMEDMKIFLSNIKNI